MKWIGFTPRCSAVWHGDGDDEGAGDDGDEDDDPDEAQLDGDDDGDNLPSPRRNYPDRFLPTGELFLSVCFLPRRGGRVYLIPPSLRFSGIMI
jgi:hypothetical protein